MIPPMSKASPRTPPTTPPTMAPVLVLFFVSSAGAVLGREVGVCTMVVNPPGPLMVINFGASVVVAVAAVVSSVIDLVDSAGVLFGGGFSL